MTKAGSALGTAGTLPLIKNVLGMFKILIDNGHGEDTPGKRSPDGKLREYAYTRALAARITEQLRAVPGIDCRRLVEEERDISLRERCRRANSLEPDLLVSLHVNAFGMGDGWCSPSGWSVFVGPQPNSGSRRASSALAREAERLGLKVRRPAPLTDFWSHNLAICRDTRCSSVLTENMFMDNREDCAFLLSAEGMEALANLHTRALLWLAE